MNLYPWDWILFAVLVAALATWIVLDRLAAHWQKQGERRLGEVDAALQAVCAAVEKGGRGAQKYSPGDREPYRTPAGKLHNTLAEMRARQPALAQQAGRLRGRCFAESSSPLLTFWYGYWARPRHCRSCSQDAKELWLSAGELHEMANDAEKSLAELEGLPLATARRCGDMLKVVQQGMAPVQALVAAQAQGDTLVAARNRLDEMASRLNALPAYFLRGSEPEIRQQASKASVCDAWKVLDEVEGPARAHAREAETWLTLLDQMRQDLATIWGFVEAADLSLLRTPATLDAGDMALDSIRSRAAGIQDWLKYPNIDDLSWEAGETGGLVEAARRAAEKAGHLVATHQLFEDTLLRGIGTLKRASDRMGKLASRAACRVDWQRSGTELDKLRTLVEEIGKLGITRTSARLEKDLARAQDLDKRARALESHVKASQEFHGELARLLEHSALPGQSWLEKAIRLSESAKPYNWNEYDSRDAEVRAIRASAESLAERHTPVARYVKRPLPEDILNEGFIGEVQSLIWDLRDFKGRLERVEGRIRDVTSKEQATRQALDARLPGLTRFLQEWKLPEADMQGSGQLATARRALAEWLETGRRHDRQLKIRDPAQILKTAKQVAAWAKSCDETGRHLLDELRSQIESEEVLLEEEMRALEAVAARLTKEPAMQDARDAVKDRRQAAKAWDSGSGADVMEHLLSLTGQMSIALTRLRQARRRVQDRAGDLISRYQEVETCRAEAEASLEQLKALGADQTAEGQEIKAILKQNEKALKHQKDWGERFDRVRAEFKAIAEEYRRAARLAAAALSQLEEQNVQPS